MHTPTKTRPAASVKPARQYETHKSTNAARLETLRRKTARKLKRGEL